MGTEKLSFAGGTQFGLVEHLSDPSRLHHYSKLEKFSEQFVKLVGSWCTSAYAWPIDPVHHCFRIWEYPYVLVILEKLGLIGSKVLDVGSATTFFPFFLAENLGADIIALDPDRLHLYHFSACARVVKRMLRVNRLPRPVQASGERTGFPDNHFDAVYCISVLEHVPNPEAIIGEMHRVLRPGGHMVLTADVAYPVGSQSDGISLSALTNLLAQIEMLFGTRLPPLKFPDGLLTYSNSPARDFSDPEILRKLRMEDIMSDPMIILRQLRRKIVGHTPRSGIIVNQTRKDLNLCVVGVVARKS